MAVTVANNADLDISIAFRHSEGGSPFDLVGVTDLIMHVRREAQDVAAVLHFSTADGSLTITNVNQGLIRATKNWTEIQHLVGSYEFDIVAIRDGRRLAIYRDQLVFSQGVTRS